MMFRFLSLRSESSGVVLERTLRSYIARDLYTISLLAIVLGPACSNKINVSAVTEIHELHHAYQAVYT